jgi:hypothetical protein
MLSYQPPLAILHSSSVTLQRERVRAEVEVELEKRDLVSLLNLADKTPSRSRVKRESSRLNLADPS